MHLLHREVHLGQAPTLHLQASEPLELQSWCAYTVGLLLVLLVAVFFLIIEDQLI